MDVDNDGAFINETVLNYCQTQKIELTRSRAYKKNDQGWIEQKNGAVVRKLVGYGRLEGAAATAALAQLHEAARLYVNFFQPSFKLKSKTREGARVVKKYHVPATPYERLLSDDRVTDECKRELRQAFSALDPVQLLSGIREAQRNLAQKEVGGGSEVAVESNRDLNQFVKSMSTAWRGGEVRATHRKPMTSPRSWRTRADPFEHVWSLVQTWLNDEPEINAKSIFQRLQKAMPEPFQPGQLRTLQRRIKQWRTEIARQLVLGCNASLQKRIARKGRGHIVMEASPPNPQDLTPLLPSQPTESRSERSSPRSGLAPQSALRAHPCVALSSAEVRPSVPKPNRKIQRPSTTPPSDVFDFGNISC